MTAAVAWNVGESIRYRDVVDVVDVEDAEGVLMMMLAGIRETRNGVGTSANTQVRYFLRYARLGITCTAVSEARRETPQVTTEVWGGDVESRSRGIATLC